MPTALPGPKRKYVRIALWTGGILLLLPILAYGALALYVNSHKKELLQDITSRLDADMQGKLLIGNMEPSLWGDFPFPSVALNDVKLRDSQWAHHHIDLLSAKQVYVRLNPLKLLSNRVDIRRLTIAHGSVTIFTDSLGYSNAYVFKKKRENETKDKEIAFHDFTMEDMELRLDDAPKNKSYGIYVGKLNGSSERAGDVWTTRVNTSARVRRLGFNLGRGTFLTNAALSGGITVIYNRVAQVAKLNAQSLRIDDQPVKLEGTLDVSRKPSTFALNLATKQVRYKKALGWLSANITKKLAAFDFTKPMDVTALVRGKIQYLDTPYVEVHSVVKNNTLVAPFARFEDCNFRLMFYNVVQPDAGHADNNSRIIVEDLKARFQSIPFRSDTIQVTNLIYPHVYFKVRSDFPLTALNDLEGDLPVNFSKGNASINVRYRGGLRTDDTLYPDVYGTVKVSNGNMNYTSRGIPFTNTNATLRLAGDDLYLDNVHTQTPGGAINMRGEALHFFRFYFSEPGKVAINWQGSSPALDMTAFKSFIGSRRKNTARAAGSAPKSASVMRIVNGFNRVLEECTAHLRLSLGSLKYGTFAAQNVQADASLASSSIDIRNLSLAHAGGTIAVSGAIQQSAAENPFSLHVNMRSVGIAQLFRSMGNFQQNAITGETINGSLTADVDASGRMSEGGKIVPRSLNGSARYALDGGQLLNFAPFVKISKITFKNRNLRDVRFQRIESQLDFTSGGYIIHPLEIRSTAFNMLVQGKYAPPSNTDIAIVLPLGKPKNEKRAGKEIAHGLVVYLRARDGKDGNVDIDWDPLKKGKKETDKQFQGPEAAEEKKR